MTQKLPQRLLLSVFTFVACLLLFAQDSYAGCGCDVGGACANPCTSPNRPACDFSDGICKRCISAQHCQAYNRGNVCLSDFKCYECGPNNGQGNGCGADICINAGTTSSSCVECESNLDCTNSNHPICSGNSCRGCLSDSECLGEENVCNESIGRCEIRDCNPGTNAGCDPECEECRQDVGESVPSCKVPQGHQY